MDGGLPQTEVSITAATTTTSNSGVNFEELISSSVTEKSSKASRTMEEKSVTTAASDSYDSEQSKPTTFTKIAPKLATNVKSMSPGQVVIIQGSAGTTQPIRIAGANPAGNKQSPVTIQVLKMPDGSLVQIKNNKALNLTNLSNVSEMNIGFKKGQLVTTTGERMQVQVKGSTIGQTISLAQAQPTKIAVTSASGTTSTILKSLTLAEAQKAGFLKVKTNEPPKTIPKIVSVSSTLASHTAITPSIVTKAANQNFIIPDNTKGVAIKTEMVDGGTKIIVPQHMLKLSPNTSGGPIQAIQIPGKSGLQYVRVLGTAASSSAAKIISTSLQAIKPKDSSPTKINMITSSTTTQRIVMSANKSKSAVTLITANKIPTSLATANQPKNIIATVPTLKKIEAPTGSKLIAVEKKHDMQPDQHPQLTKIQISQLQNPNKRPNIAGTKWETAVQNGSSHQSEGSGSKPHQYMIVTNEVLNQIKANEQNKSISPAESELNVTRKLYSVLKEPSPDPVEEIPFNKLRRTPSPDTLRRKHCNCTKSQCLKLYCDCFANGEFCQDCNCKECFNNLEYEDERQKAIRLCLDRNPNAFKPKITKGRQSDLRLHNKGCNCKRSGCLKNYCECYEAKIACSSNCKCFGCRNIEDRTDLTLVPQAVKVSPLPINSARGVAIKRPYEESEKQNTSGQPPNKQQPYNFITQDVVDATIQCMIAQADECKKGGIAHHRTELMILEELGRCLVEIIDFSIRNMSE